MSKGLLVVLAALLAPRTASACAVCTLSLVDYYLPPAWGWLVFGLVGLPLLSALMPADFRARAGLPMPKVAAGLSVLTFALLFVGAPLILLLAGWTVASSLRALRLELPRRAKVPVRAIAGVAIALIGLTVATHVMRDRVSYLSAWPSSPMSRNFVRLALESGDEELLERFSHEDPETFLMLLEARIEPERDAFLIPLIEGSLDELPPSSAARPLASGYLEELRAPPRQAEPATP